MTWDTVLTIDVIVLILVILLPMVGWLLGGKQPSGDRRAGSVLVSLAVGLGALGIAVLIWFAPSAKPTPQVPPVYRIRFNAGGAIHLGTAFHFRVGRGRNVEHYLATCFHVVKAALPDVALREGVIVLPAGGKQSTVFVERRNHREAFRVIAFDAKADIALLKPVKANLLAEWSRQRQPMFLAESPQLRAGQSLLSYGFPGSENQAIFEDYSVRQDPKNPSSPVRLNGKAEKGQSGSPVLLPGEEGQLGGVVGILKAIELKQPLVGEPQGRGMLTMEVWICPVERLRHLLAAVEKSQVHVLD